MGPKTKRGEEVVRDFSTCGCKLLQWLAFAIRKPGAMKKPRKNRSRSVWVRKGAGAGHKPIDRGALQLGEKGQR